MDLSPEKSSQCLHVLRSSPILFLNGTDRRHQSVRVLQWQHYSIGSRIEIFQQCSTRESIISIHDFETSPNDDTWPPCQDKNTNIK